MADKVRVLVVGLGNMGKSHASAYHRNDGFEIVGMMSRSIKSNTDIPDELKGYPLFEDFDAALAETKPDAVSINSWPNSHAEYAIKAMNAGAHVFMEKPIATTVEDAEKVVAVARATNRKLVLGYILRVHPSWIKFIELGQTLGKPLVMRLNLNQRSGLDLAQEPDRQPDPDRRLRCALRRRDVPDDQGKAGAGARHWRRPVGRCRQAELRPSACDFR